jgi:hypothetical protein
MEKYINKYGKEVYRGVSLDTDFDVNCFHKVNEVYDDDSQIALHTNIGSITVLTRMTGFGYVDTETGFRDIDGRFWLASGMCDVTKSGVKTIGEAIEWIKKFSNTCVGIPR